MKKELTLEDLKALQAKALANYASCGCKIYKEEANALSVRIRQLEAEKTA